MNTITTDLINCARCGGNHPKIDFRPLTRPMGRITHFALCPATVEPVLLCITFVGDERNSIEVPIVGKQIHTHGQ